MGTELDALDLWKLEDDPATHGLLTRLAHDVVTTSCRRAMAVLSELATSVELRKHVRNGGLLNKLIDLATVSGDDAAVRPPLLTPRRCKRSEAFIRSARACHKMCQQ